MNVWKRLSKIEDDVILLFKRVGSSSKAYYDLIDRMNEAEKTVYGSLKSDCSTPIIWGGLSGRVSGLKLIIKEQGELIEQLAALLGKKITEPEESEYSKILVDGDAK